MLNWTFSKYQIDGFMGGLMIFLPLQRRVSGASQGDSSTFRHEEDQQAEPDPEEPDPTGLRGTRHPDVRREPVCRLHVLFFRDQKTPLHGDGVCGG